MPIYTQRNQVLRAIGSAAPATLQILVDDCIAGEVAAAQEPDAAAYDAAEFLEWLRAEFMATIRTAAQEWIVSVYPLWHQANVAMGIYPAEVGQAAKDWIASVIAESNRCEDLAYAAEGHAGIVAITPNWPEKP